MHVDKVFHGLSEHSGHELGGGERKLPTLYLPLGGRHCATCEVSQSVAELALRFGIPKSIGNDLKVQISWHTFHSAGRGGTPAAQDPQHPLCMAPGYVCKQPPVSRMIGLSSGL